MDIVRSNGKYTNSLQNEIRFSGDSSIIVDGNGKSDDTAFHSKGLVY